MLAGHGLAVDEYDTRDAASAVVVLELDGNLAWLA